MGDRVMKLLKDNEMDIPVVYGGTILKDDRQRLLALGIKETFAPGTMMKDIIQTFKKLVPEDRAQ
jgi:methylmalonyl-CoA mutase cobalamin-binding domain/chain